MSIRKDKERIIISSFDDINNPNYGGGGAYAVFNTAKQLSRKFKVTVITFKYQGSKSEIINSVFYKRIGFSFAGPRLGQVLYHLMLPVYVMKEKYDLWIESFTPPVSTSFLQLFTARPIIGLVHMLSGEEMKRKYRLPFDFIESIGLKTYKHFVVVNKESVQRIRQANTTAEIRTIPNGIDLKDFNSPDENKKIVLFMGRIEVKQKGLDILLEAYKQIVNKTQCNLVIAGTGLNKEIILLKKLIIENGLESRVRFVGKVINQKKDILYRQAFCVVIPSRYETFSITALEAFSYGIPVVGFDIKGLSWISKESMLRVKPFSGHELAKSILKILTDSALREKLSKSSIKEVSKHLWKDIGINYTNYVSDILLRTNYE